MPISLGVAGYALKPHERIEALVAGVGGPVKAAQLTGKTRGTIDNWRKPGAVLPLFDLLPLCIENGVSLDWVATGYQMREDLQRLAEAGELRDAGGRPAFDALPGFVRLQPLLPETLTKGGATIERWAPSDLAVSPSWLDASFGATPDQVRYGVAGDDGMAPRIGKGAFLIVDMRPASWSPGLYLVRAGATGQTLLARRLDGMPDGRARLVADRLSGWLYELEPGVEPSFLMRRILWIGEPA